MSWLPLARRSFLSQLGTGASAAIGAATLVAGGATLRAQSSGSARRQPRRYAQDNWLDELPGQHRLLLDTTTATGLGNALLYANNFLNSSQTDYGLKDADSAVVIVGDISRPCSIQRRDLGQYAPSSRSDQLQRSADSEAGHDQRLQLDVARGGPGKPGYHA